MTNDNTQSTDSEENIVRTTVRMDESLHTRLSDYVSDRGRGLPRKERPSLDAIIQEAIVLLIEAPDQPAATPDGLRERLRSRPSIATLNLSEEQWEIVEEFARMVQCPRPGDEIMLQEWSRILRGEVQRRKELTRIRQKTGEQRQRE